MYEVYEYRQSGRRPVVWLTAVIVVFLLVFGLTAGASQVVTAVWGMAAALTLWMLLSARQTGIRVDDSHLILSAWTRPRAIALDDIAYLRATHWTAESAVTIVYRDGREEGTHALDMPPINVLAEVMAERGIPIRDPQLAHRPDVSAIPPAMRPV